MIEVFGFSDNIKCRNQRLFQTGDIIISYGDSLITNQDMLISLIANAKFAYFWKIPVKIMRDGRLITIDVEEGKLGLKLKEVENSKQYSDSKFDYVEHPSDRELLDKANETIRLANKRINDLKLQLLEKEHYINSLHSTVEELSNMARVSDCGLSDLELFGFRETPEINSIKSRYKKLATVYHPDKGGCDTMMKRINEAYQRLLDI